MLIIIYSRNFKFEQHFLNHLHFRYMATLCTILLPVQSSYDPPHLQVASHVLVAHK